MAVLDIPILQDDRNFEFDIDLDGVTFRLRLKFNSRDAAWYLSIFNADDVLIRAGIRVVSDWILNRLIVEGGPAGDIITVNLDGTIDVPDADQLGSDVTLSYIEES